MRGFLLARNRPCVSCCSAADVLSSSLPTLPVTAPSCSCIVHAGIGVVLLYWPKSDAAADSVGLKASSCTASLGSLSSRAASNSSGELITASAAAWTSAAMLSTAAVAMDCFEADLKKILDRVLPCAPQRGVVHSPVAEGLVGVRPDKGRRRRGTRPL